MFEDFVCFVFGFIPDATQELLLALQELLLKVLRVPSGFKRIELRSSICKESATVLLLLYYYCDPAITFFN